MTGGPTDLGNTILGKGKGRASAMTADMIDNKQARNEHSRAQPEPSNSTPGSDPHPEASSQGRKGSMKDRIADAQQEQANQQARTAAARNAIAQCPEGPQENHSRREAAPSLETQSEVFVTPEPQRVDNPQRGETSNRAHTAAGRSAARAARPTNMTTIDLTDDDTTLPANNITLNRTEISEPAAELGRVVKTLCTTHCNKMAQVVARRSDIKGKQLHQRCVGTSLLLRKPNTLIKVQELLGDVKALVKDVQSAVDEQYKMYLKFFNNMMNDTGHESVFEPRILDHQSQRLDIVKQAAEFFSRLVEDLEEQSRTVRRREFGV